MIWGSLDYLINEYKAFFESEVLAKTIVAVKHSAFVKLSIALKLLSTIVVFWMSC